MFLWLYFFNNMNEEEDFSIVFSIFVQLTK